MQGICSYNVANFFGLRGGSFVQKSHFAMSKNKNTAVYGGGIGF